ncbi:hypothetical protein MWU53_01790 [Aliiroseovarius sp. S1123]|uniref:Uncharacterized protein n=1 Tax=Aliiroseovarius pelagivivens TaxID=1639690 RepID=A0A2R8AKD0_9RHOB|nr:MULTISPECIES: hypothetical protein [Aliiroseovarius]MCK0169783.1 hypothetical protein [Aliiroseovarius sp. S1123]SPF76344.1 hypothetical protein ALP8811_01348 [Aliiroseovarius pelagivivens]
MAKLKVGGALFESIENLSLDQIYPEVVGRVNLNTCGNPDCGNFGFAFNPDIPDPRGGSSKFKLAAASSAAISAGVGQYKLSSSGKKEDARVSSILEYGNEPRAWMDTRTIVCQHKAGNRKCGLGQKVLSNAHFVAETNRLRSMNGVLDGPRCGSCGKRYLEDPTAFALDGANGKTTPRKGSRKGGKPLGMRVVCKACKGQRGSRFTVSAPHRRQKERTENIQILNHLVNESGMSDMRRIFRSPDGRRQVGMSRFYDRIFWLEEVLLAYEKAQLDKWRKDHERLGKFRHHKIAHDDIVLSVNWETRTDRRLTQLNCSISADIDSGYIYRIDVDFDPTIDPANYLLDHYGGRKGPVKIRKTYTKADGTTFTAPLLEFQRPSGRYEEGALFAAAESEFRLFGEKVHEKLKRAKRTPDASLQFELDRAEERRLSLSFLRRFYFNFPASERDTRNSFSGIMTRDTYTKAAHLECLREMLPSGKITLVSEQEAAMARVVPHIFREDIKEDLFEWLVVSFNKKATKGQITSKFNRYDASLRRFRNANPNLAPYEALHAWTEARLKPAYKPGRSGDARPFPISNFATRAFPDLWIRSPVQFGGETDKVVGFPVLSRRYREQFKALGIDSQIKDPDLCKAITRRVVRATLQPASSFMEAVRERISMTDRASSGGARKGPSFENGASYNPRVLIAILNIFRVHYNFFEFRQYVTSRNKHDETEEVEMTMSSIAVPGENIRIPVEKHRKRAPIENTPAIRLGVQKVSSEDEQPSLPNLSRVLYKPWLLYGTPLWTRLS